MGTHGIRRLRLTSKGFLATAVGVIAGAGTAAGLLVALGGSAGAAGGTNYSDLAKGKGYHTCLDPKTLVPTAWNGKPQAVFWPNDAAHPIFCVNGRIPAVFGATGPAGPAGTVHPVSATGSTAVTNYTDSGMYGPGWATDQFTVKGTVTLDHTAASSDQCGSTASSCYLYVADITRDGTFQTVPTDQGTGQPLSPVKGDPINGVNPGTLNAVIHMTFYASSAAPDASRVATSNGDPDTPANPSQVGNWARSFFPDDTSFGAQTTDSVFTYTTSNTCETWHAEYHNGTLRSQSGDITGTSSCN